MKDIQNIIDQLPKFKVAVLVSDEVSGEQNADLTAASPTRAGASRSLNVRLPPFNLRCNEVHHLHPGTSRGGGVKTTCVVLRGETPKDLDLHLEL